MEGIGKGQVSRVCAAPDAEVERFRTRRLAGAYPYLWLDATFLKARDGERAVTNAVVVAVGVTAEGRREVLGFGVGPSEDGAVWGAFPRSLVGRGLRGVELVTSDAHKGLKGATAAVLHGASWRDSGRRRGCRWDRTYGSRRCTPRRTNALSPSLPPSQPVTVARSPLTRFGPRSDDQPNDELLQGGDISPNSGDREPV